MSTSTQKRTAHVFTAELPEIEGEIRGFLTEIDAAEVRVGRIAVEIGRRLHFVKVNGLIHGQWEPWLRSVGLVPVTARKYVQVYERFGNRSTSIDLPIGKMFELLSLPAETDLDTFMAELHTTASGEKPVANMTVKELRAVVRQEREAAGLITAKPEEPPNGAASSSASRDPFEISGLSEVEVETLERLPLCVARRVVALDPSEIVAMLSVAAALSSALFSENYPDILSGLRAGKSAVSIAASYKQPHNRQSFGGIAVDPYEVFDVYEGDSYSAIRGKYRSWMKVLHPDSGGSDFLFRLVTEAWREYQREEA
ncbi:DUF3102 domain-containing protein [Paenibacillus algorifonticola]|uniref:DUF3102 domain-containing protein n=1 Tax=Paenibacillus algorifonticola TaxID=684063 RepID=UPI003D2A956C